MNQDYTIELAAAVHVRAIPGIEQAAAAMFSEIDLPPDIRYLVTDMETLVEAQRQRRLWAALDDKRTLVGFALARVVGRFAHLEELGVHPEHARQGIGSRLLDTVTTWARDGGYPGITLITFRHSSCLETSTRPFCGVTSDGSKAIRRSKSSWKV